MWAFLSIRKRKAICTQGHLHPGHQNEGGRGGEAQGHRMRMLSEFQAYPPIRYPRFHLSMVTMDTGMPGHNLLSATPLSYALAGESLIKSGMMSFLRGG